MSNAQVEEHSSPIKTPGQLITVVVLAFVVPISAAVLLSQLVTSGFKTDTSAQSDEAISQRIKPVGQVNLVDPNAPKVVRSGQEIVDTVCAACHKTGALNAPKIGDKAAWAKLIPQGLDTLVADAIKGVRQMPARGGNPDLTDLEMARAVAYMANQSGASFKEPEAAKPAAAAPAAPKK